MANALKLENLSKVARVPRRPQHRWRIDAKPWEIAPFLLAPVVPGETLKNATLQARVVTDPVAARLVGWWQEYYVFYVKHRQLPSAATYMNMMLDPTATLATSAASARDYYNGYGHNWGAACLETIVNKWFRKQGTTWLSNVIRTGRPAARLNIDSVLQSLTDTTVLADGGTLGSTQEAQDQLADIYEFLRAQSFTKMTYEDFLASYGVRGRAIDEDRPELLRYVRDWQYPTNTVEPTTGVATTALSWAISERIDKDRFFQEPGFIFGVTISRPKVYLSNQTGNGSVALDRAMRWLPAILADDPSTSLAEFATNAGPLGKSAGGLTNGYWLDLRDLFVYGDQWVDATAQKSDVALPTVAAVYEYATEAMADALFSGTGKLVQQDGVFSASILGTQIDHT